MTLESDISNGNQVVVFAVIDTTMKTFDWVLEPSLGTGSNVYSHTLKASSVTSFTKNGSAWTAHSSLAGFATPTASRYYFDLTEQKIYGDFTSSLPILDSVFYTVNYKYCASNLEVPFYLDPTNNASAIVPWFPVVQGFPTLTRDVSDFNFGTFKQTTSSLTMSYLEDNLKSDLLASRLVGSSVTIYIGSRSDVGLIDYQKVRKIFMSSIESVTSTEDTFTLALVENLFNLDGVYPNPVTGTSTYDSTLFANGDSEYLDTIIPIIYGIVIGHRPFCNPRDDSITAINHAGQENKAFSIGKFPSSINLNNLKHSYTVQSSPAPTTTRIYLNTTQYLNQGDVIYSETKEQQFVVINVTSSYVDGYAGDLATSPGNADPIVGGDVLIRTMVGHMQTIAKNNIRTDGFVSEHHYYFNANPDPNFSWDGLQLIYQVFSGRVVANRRNAANMSTLDIKFKVYGYPDLTLPEASSLSSRTGTRSKWFQVLYHYLRAHVGLANSQLNTALFTTLNSDIANQEDVGIVLPEIGSTKHLQATEVIKKILVGRFSHVYVNNDFKLDFFIQGPMGAADFSFTKDDLIKGLVSYQTTHQDLVSKIIYEYRQGFFTLKKYSTTPASDRVMYSNKSGFTAFESSSTQATSFYGSTKETTVQSLVYFEDDADKWANRGLHILGYPKNVLSFSVSLEFLSIDIGDVIEVDLSGMDFLAQTSTTGTFKGRVISKTIDANEIRLSIWDQIGIEQNQGDW